MIYRIKKALSILIALCIVFGTCTFAVNQSDLLKNTMSISAQASYKVTVTASSLILRSGKGTSYKKLASIPKNTTLTITSVSGKWGKTTYKGKTGWVCLDYTKKVSTSYNVTVTASSLILRSGKGTSYKKLVSIPKNTTLTITSVSGKWGKTTYKGKTGWVCLDYTKKVSQTTSGSFKVVCYGYGHGVGMSQTGAELYANKGKTYSQILIHYYTGTKIATDSSLPSKVKYGNKSYKLNDYLAYTANAEIGSGAPLAALEAQIVAVYTYAKYYGYELSTSQHALKTLSDYKNTNIGKALKTVRGKYIAYNGKAVFACYCSSVGKKTSSSKSAWGTELPYLKGGVSSPETVSKTYYFSADTIKSNVKANLGISLSGNPSKWFSSIKHDSSVNSSTGYVSSLKIGGTTVTGEKIRSKIFDSDIRSRCIKITYVA